MTVEAALCLPLFLFFAASLMEPMNWLDRQRKVQAAVEHFCGDLSQYMYMKETGTDGEDGEDGEDAGYLALVSNGAASLWLKGKLRDYVDDAVIREACVPDENGDILFRVSYKEELPFFRLPEGSTHMYAAARRRSWIGIDGKLKLEGEQGDADGTDETMVYVGAGMGKYHLYKDCHYISNKYETVSVNQAKEMRNASGGRYQPCSRCAKSGNAGGDVYITISGEHYHFSKSCSAMVSYVRRVPLEEAEHLGLCSYCAGR